MNKLSNTITSTFNRLPTLAITALMALALMAQGCILVVDDGSITVTNDTGADLVELYIVDSSAASWGSGIGLPGGFLAPGESIEMEADGGLWDVRAVDNFGIEYEDRSIIVIDGLNSNVSIDPTDEVITIVDPLPEPTTGTLVIANDIDWGDVETILEGLFIASSNDSAWGDNWIEGAPILFGGFATIEDMAAGTYDLQALDQNGDSYVVMGFDVIAGATTEVTLTTADFEETVAVGLLLLNPGVKLQLVRRTAAG
jgi:hypothetical protein